MNILGIIPARKNSKRLPDKNIRNLCGKPMITYTIEEAKKSKYLEKIIISSDDDRMEKIAEKYNVDFLFRPKELAQDSTPTIDVVKHVVKKLEDEINYIPEIIVLLQPSSPLRIVEDINNGILMYTKNNFDSVVSVKEVAPHIFYPNGAVYVFTDEIWTENIGLYLMPKERSIDIDEEIDFWLAEQILGGKK